MGEPVIVGHRLLDLADVRCFIAEQILGARRRAPDAVGEISLWPHQRDAVTRLRAAIAEFGGALLADDVGTGKTFVGLAVAAEYAAPLVVAPAALRDRWRDAASRAGREASFASFEALSRGATITSRPDFVIVDEAHHVRNPLTKRYGTLASIVADTPTLLLTATPIHNRRADLLALLSLFRGSASGALDDAALSRCVIRRGREVLDGAAPLPIVRGPIAITCEPSSDDTPAAILSLPPPVPAADAGIASALLAISLLRQWASSQGALLAAINRRLAASHALASTLDDGHYPTRAELASWTFSDDVQQVVMTALFASAAELPASNELRGAIAAHIDGLRAVRRAASRDPELDQRRAARLHDIWRSHPGQRSIAFSQFAGTVQSYWSALRREPGVCALTADGAMVASGSISRAEALGSFAPGHAPRATPTLDIDALLVTDLASEGLDLQDASVLVHLDLPWTPARLEQRVGRIVRPGSPHPIVQIYTMEPPAGTAALLDIRRRLSTKLAAARVTLGAVMPDVGVALGLPVERAMPAAPVAAEEVERILDRWRGMRTSAQTRDGHREPVVAVAPGLTRGWLALVGEHDPRLVAFVDGAATDDPATLARAVTAVDAAAPNRDPADGAVATSFIDLALAELNAWIDSRRAATLAGVDDIALVRGRRRALAAVARLTSVPASSRHLTASSARDALAVAQRPLGAARERDLRELGARAWHSDGEFFDAVARLGANPPPSGEAEPVLRALVVLVPR